MSIEDPVRFLDLSISAFVLVQVANTTGQQPNRLSLEAHILQEVKVEPIDCGTHPLYKPDPDALHRSLACARDALKEHQAFKFMQRDPGIDSEVAFGALGLRDGAVLWFSYDSHPCGSPLCNESFEARQCGLALVVHDADGTHRLVACGYR